MEAGRAVVPTTGAIAMAWASSSSPTEVVVAVLTRPLTIVEATTTRTGKNRSLNITTEADRTPAWVAALSWAAHRKAALTAAAAE